MSDLVLEVASAAFEDLHAVHDLEQGKLYRQSLRAALEPAEGVARLPKVDHAHAAVERRS